MNSSWRLLIRCRPTQLYYLMLDFRYGPEWFPKKNEFQLSLTVISKYIFRLITYDFLLGFHGIDLYHSDFPRYRTSEILVENCTKYHHRFYSYVFWRPYWWPRNWNIRKLECGPMPNVMDALPNIGDMIWYDMIWYDMDYINVRPKADEKPA